MFVQSFWFRFQHRPAQKGLEGGKLGRGRDSLEEVKMKSNSKIVYVFFEDNGSPAALHLIQATSSVIAHTRSQLYVCTLTR